ncbi:MULTISPECIES: pentapeptide repeat-containing protein [Burkholderia]|uniref:Pentapeptide repeat family protein n=1 Tax=Burkholderia singularis TaxID=1503053 RepID=A0A238H0W6_9BURK|nr:MULTISPECIES: pentapeptide repeat-containing protein [Burkholderia]AOK29360.1 hypothetical protein AQ611_07870 [Burkholderia sp. Bp7605]SMF98901.1 Pentapeptide repeat family protein [Burkholderia singularis]
MNGPQLPMLAPTLPQVIKGRHYTTSHRELDLSDTIYEDCHFDQLTWRGCRLSNLRFVNCRFDSNLFEGCELINLIYEDCRVGATRWKDCVQRGVSFTGGEIADAVWADSLMRDAIFSKMTGSSWQFDAVRSAHVSFVASEFTDIAVNGGRWSDTSWIDVRIAGIEIQAAELENFIVGQSGCSRCTLSKCRGINVRWIDSQIERMTLHGCELKQAAWSHSTWSSGRIGASRLPLASFDHAKVNNLMVRDTELPQAIFDHASVMDSDLLRLHAPRIAFRHAQLSRVQLSGAQLQGLDARGARLDEVDLKGSDCRSGLLIGQPKQAWLAANTRQAIFDEAAAEDDHLWRQRTQPGARGV